MMNKLPKTIRAKKLRNKKLTLIATAADGNVGLYCRGTPKAEDSKYRILTRAGKMTRGMIGSGGYPVAPHDLKWVWKSAKKKRKKERKMAATAIDPRAGRLKEIDRKPLKLSESVRCQECRKDVRKMSHAHTLVHPEKGYAQTFCCKCRRMMGYICAYKLIKKLSEETKERMEAIKEGTKHGRTVVVLGTKKGKKKNGKASHTASKHARDKTHKRRRKGASKRHRHSRHRD